MTRLERQLSDAMLILAEVADELPAGSPKAQTLVEVVRLLEHLDSGAGQVDESRREEVATVSTMTH